MKRFLIATVFLSLITLIPSTYAQGNDTDLKLWGTQVAGSGHAKNAKTDGNTLVLTAPATIVSVKADCDSYTIWSVVTRENRTASAVLSGGKGRPDLVGKTLPAGSYRVLAGLGNKNTAKVTIMLK